MNMPKQPSAQRSLRADARRNRDSILKTAFAHFRENGVSASLDDIARDAGVGPGTLYRHFPNRKILLQACLQDRFEDFSKTAEWLKEISDPDDALFFWVMELQDYARSFGGLANYLLEAYHEKGSPLFESCRILLELTDMFLKRAQALGHARQSMNGAAVFLAAVGTAWLLDEATHYGTDERTVQLLLANGYFEDNCHKYRDALN